MGKIVYICSNCGAIIKTCRWNEKKEQCFNGVNPPISFVSRYFRCPVCGNTLKIIPKLIIYNDKKEKVIQEIDLNTIF